MNEKNTKYLYETYPNLYRQHNLPIDQTCMCWGFECGDGWFGIINDLSKKIVEIAPDVEAVQVKEKFGGLRFYINGGTDEVYALINKAEDLSYKTCEYCGSTENVTQTRGWIVSLCPLCKLEQEQSRANRI